MIFKLKILFVINANKNLVQFCNAKNASIKFVERARNK
jgi:hypothetical protein